MSSFSWLSFFPCALMMKSNLYSIPPFSPLVEVLDEQKGYCLLKNLCSMYVYDMNYTVGIMTADGFPKIVMDSPDNVWLRYDNADEIMRVSLKRQNYNKASLDFFGKDDY